MDLSTAFDTIDHGILLSRLNSLYGISGDALDWVNSYLSNRVQHFSLVTQSRHARILTLGYPRGRYWDPRFIARHGLSHLFYTDDSKLYIVIGHSANIHSELLRIERCVADISNWMRHNMLKLNNDKTELIVFASIVCEPQIKNLGVIFDLLYRALYKYCILL